MQPRCKYAIAPQNTLFHNGKAHIFITKMPRFATVRLLPNTFAPIAINACVYCHKCVWLLAEHKSRIEKQCGRTEDAQISTKEEDK